MRDRPSGPDPRCYRRSFSKRSCNDPPKRFFRPRRDSTTDRPESYRHYPIQCADSFPVRTDPTWRPSNFIYRAAIHALAVCPSIAPGAHRGRVLIPSRSFSNFRVPLPHTRSRATSYSDVHVHDIAVKWPGRRVLIRYVLLWKSSTRKRRPGNVSARAWIRPRALRTLFGYDNNRYLRKRRAVVRSRVTRDTCRYGARPYWKIARPPETRYYDGVGFA